MCNTKPGRHINSLCPASANPRQRILLHLLFSRVSIAPHCPNTDRLFALIFRILPDSGSLALKLDACA